MKQDPLIERYNHLSESFDSSFEETFQKQGIEDIHKLRVTIKKLRALWSLMELTNQGEWFKEEHYNLSSKLFSEAGKVREGQINLSMLSKNKSKYLQPYKEYLKSSQELSNQNLLLHMTVFDRGKFALLNKELNVLMQRQSSQSILEQSLNYVAEQISEVHRLINELPDDRKLHKIRIHLKAVAEILNLMNNLDEESRMESYLKDIKEINAQIGKWHDYKVLHKSLKRFNKKFQMETRNKWLESLINRIKDTHRSKQNAIIELLGNRLAQKPPDQIKNLYLLVGYFQT